MVLQVWCDKHGTPSIHVALSMVLQSWNSKYGAQRRALQVCYSKKGTPSMILKVQCSNCGTPIRVFQKWFSNDLSSKKLSMVLHFGIYLKSLVVLQIVIYYLQVGISTEITGGDFRLSAPMLFPMKAFTRASKSLSQSCQSCFNRGHKLALNSLVTLKDPKKEDFLKLFLQAEDDRNCQSCLLS